MTRQLLRLAVVAFVVAALLALAWQMMPATYPRWSAAELATIDSLSLARLEDLPADPGNAVADDPNAAELGRKLFFDGRLSANGAVSCATCHQPIRRFTDGLQRGQAIGSVDRNTPSIVASAYSPWQFWDGRRDSLWAQALVPVEHPDEHNFSRAEVAALMRSDPDYSAAFERVFGVSPGNGSSEEVDATFVRVGKAIAAFERTVLPTESRFDRYAAALRHGNSGETVFSAVEARGLQLFIGKANCIQCHNGPLLTNNEFHNTGVINLPGELPDLGRAAAVAEVLADPFNCRGEYSDAERCDELDFVRSGVELVGAFRTASLRNLGNTAPYMHRGQLPHLAAVLEHYNVAADAMIGHNEAKPLKLSDRQLQNLEAFLLTLDAPISGIDVRR